MAIIAPDIGIDMGTSKTLVYVRKKGILIDEPTVLVMERGGKHAVRAIGDEALSLLGRTADDVVAVRPLSEGMIKDFDMTKYMLQYFVRKAIGSSRLVKPRAIITVPCRITAIERRAVRQAALYAGVRPSHLHLVEKPFAAALGCGLPVFQPTGSMVVDIGGGTTEVAVISLGGVVVAKSIRMGGIKMDEAVAAYIKREYNMLIGDRTAEDIKLNLGSALPVSEYRDALIRGRDMVTNLPRTASIGSDKVYEALKAPCAQILGAIKSVLEHTPPELAGDVMRSGIHLTGGASQLFGLDQYIASALGIKVQCAKDAAACAGRGVGELAEHFDHLARIGKSSFLRDDQDNN